jgi:hypothetical protein
VDDLKAVFDGPEGWTYPVTQENPDMPPRPYPVPMTPQADAYDVDLDRRLLEMQRKFRGSPFVAVVGRYREQIRRVALVAAVADAPAAPTLESRHLEWAERLVRLSMGTLIRQAKRFLADSEHEKHLKRLLDVIRGYCGKHGGEMSGYELANRTRWLEPKRRDELLKQLEELGEVEARAEETRLGRKPKRWVRVMRR